MIFVLVEDEARCNFCVYWTGMRNKSTDLVCADTNSAEYGICLHPNAACYGQPMASCEGYTLCITQKL